MSEKCNHNCLFCTHEDCDNDVLTATEKMEASQRDRNYTDYGNIVLKARPRKAKHRGARN